MGGQLQLVSDSQHLPKQPVHDICMHLRGGSSAPCKPQGTVPHLCGTPLTGSVLDHVLHKAPDTMHPSRSLTILVQLSHT
jgi:hypothetical protein